MSKIIKGIFLILVVIIFAVGGVIAWSLKQIPKVDSNIVCEVPSKNFWQIQSVDTMKQSRDLVRVKLYDKTFDKSIDKQVVDIAEIGATHIAIATPYDKEFVPFLKRWIESARKNNLNVWLRGNWSGWEGWFDYPKNLSLKKHIQKTVSFIENNPELFQDGDIFSPCPECENGNIGDPRQTKRVDEFRKFIIDEYEASQDAFGKINKNVIISYPFNGDVAKLVMDKKTTNALGGYVTIDHYVKTPEQTISDIKKISESSEGKIILGEFGVPILDIHKNFSKDDQVKWIDEFMQKVSLTKELFGVNYWVNIGGSTAIWNKDGSPTKSVAVLRKAFNPYIIYGRVVDEFGQSIKNAKISINNKNVSSDNNGCFLAKFISNNIQNKGIVSSDGFLKNNFTTLNKITQKNIKLIKKDKDWKFNFKLWLKNRFDFSSTKTFLKKV